MFLRSLISALQKQTRRRLKRQVKAVPALKSLHIPACIVWESNNLWVCILLSPQEYEERLAKLQAEYNAQQESKEKLQQDIAALRCSHEANLSYLEKSRASRGSALPKNGIGK